MKQTFKQLKQLSWQDPDRIGQTYWSACYDDEDLHILFVPTLGGDYWFVIICYHNNNPDTQKPESEEFYKLTSEEILEKLGIEI